MTEYKVKVYSDRTEWFNLEGKLHREDGPAVEYANVYKAYYINGKLHKEDGPAIEGEDGDKAYFINGKYLTEKQFNNRNKPCEGKIVEMDGVKYKLTQI